MVVAKNCSKNEPKELYGFEEPKDPITKWLVVVIVICCVLLFIKNLFFNH